MRSGVWAFVPVPATMTDFSPPWRVDPAGLPQSTIYDPADDQDAPPVSAPVGTVVVLLVGDADRRWASQTAFELSAAWARGGRRIVLADMHFENPLLHESAGDDSLEGMVDIFLYGASVARSAHPGPGRGFHLIAAGTYTPDLEAIYHHPRWAKLVAGFRDAEAALVLFAPIEGTDLQALTPWVSEALVLGTVRDAELTSMLAEAGIPIRAHIIGADTGPVARPAPPPTVLLPGPEPPVRRELSPEMHLPPPPMRPAPRSRPMIFALLLLGGIVLLAAIGYTIGRLRPDLVPWLGGMAGSDSAATPLATQSVVSAGPTPAGQTLPYSIQVIAFPALPPAMQRLEVDRERVTQAPVFISPEEIDGIVFYKILAGALPDTMSARALREELVAGGVVNEDDAVGSWALIQNAPLSFQLDDYPAEAPARAAVDSLVTRNVPAYAVRVPYSDGSERWQLYAGAYADLESASAMRTLLASAGLTPPLVFRSGSPPPPLVAN